MNNNLERMVYPGEHVPRATEDEVRSALQKMKRSKITSVPVSVKEADGTYVVEIIIPGVEKENFLVYADNNVLSVCVYNIQSILSDKNNAPKYSDRFERKIDLPADADTTFMVAEYKTGILKIFISKTEGACTGLHNRIVVY